MACPFNKFTILNQDEKQKQCLEKCPEGYNYIGGNNTCLQKCSDQPSIGQYFIEIDGSNGYPIYKCSQSCGDNYTVFNTKECSNKCPEDYYESPNQICYLHNCTNDADYPFTTVDKDEKKICAKKCHESQPNYGDDKIYPDEETDVILLRTPGWSSARNTAKRHGTAPIKYGRKRAIAQTAIILSSVLSSDHLCSALSNLYLIFAVKPKSTPFGVIRRPPV